MRSLPALLVHVALEGGRVSAVNRKHATLVRSFSVFNP